MSGSAAGVQAAVIRAADAEELAGETVAVRLLLDSADTGGALSSLRVTLRGGADGATPHVHRRSSELFYVTAGRVQVLTGDQVLTGAEGDLLVVPPGLAHAFAAPPGEDGELLIVITPGVQRFEYFRHLARIARGQQSPESLLEVQDRYDTHFCASEPWRELRAD